MHKSLYPLLLALILLATACGGGSESPDPGGVIIQPTIIIKPSYPGPEETPKSLFAYPPPAESDQLDFSGYPGPPTVSSGDAAYPGAATPFQTSTPTAEELLTPEPPTPLPGKGAVVGQLVYGDAESPGSNLTVYLGIKVEANPGPGYLISTQRNSSPQADTNGGGYFVINDVEPGTYALVLGSLIASRVLENPDTGEEYWVEIMADEVADVGQAVFTLP